MSEDSQAIDSNPQEAFSGFCQFIDWWTEFQRLHCEGIDSTWSASADHFVRFRFQKEINHFQYAIDLKDPDISQALFRMQIGLLKLQDAPNVKTNESES